MVTELVPVRFLPVIVIAVPPAAGPVFGVTDEIVGNIHGGDVPNFERSNDRSATATSPSPSKSPNGALGVPQTLRRSARSPAPTVPSRSRSPNARSQRSRIVSRSTSASSPLAISHASGMPFALQSCSAPVAMSQKSKVPFELQSGEIDSVAVTSLEAFAHSVALTNSFPRIVTAMLPPALAATSAFHCFGWITNTAVSGVAGQSLAPV